MDRSRYNFGHSFTVNSPKNMKTFGIDVVIVCSASFIHDFGSEEMLFARKSDSLCVTRVYASRHARLTRGYCLFFSSFWKSNLNRTVYQQQDYMNIAGERRDVLPTLTTRAGFNDSETHQVKPVPLDGVGDLIAEYFNCGPYQIIYEWGIYLPNKFKRYINYNRTNLISTVDDVETYLHNVL